MAMHEYLATEVALDHAERLITRREALRRLGLLGLSATSAAALLAACGGDDSTASSTTVPTTTAVAASSTTSAATTTSAAPAAGSSDIEFTGQRGRLFGTWAAAAQPRGAVLIIHENRGLTAHIKSLPSRFAASGYSALAVDLLSEEGGTALMDEGAASAALGRAPEERLVADMRSGLDELERRAPGVKLAAVGFCFGGGMVWRLLAAGEPRLAAAVPFYGPAPANPDFSKSKAAVLGIYGELDSRVNGTRDAAKAGLTAAGLTHELRTFAGADHAFFNDTGARYIPTAAAEAYQAVLAWFGTHLE